jgi:MFS superfamily sulfate permease-like transporter
VADRALRTFTGQGVLVRVAMLVLAAVVIMVAIPFAIVAGVLFFVVFPILGLGGWHHGRWAGGRTRQRRGRW